jgi:penicillin-binding protein 1B
VAVKVKLGPADHSLLFRFTRFLVLVALVLALLFAAIFAIYYKHYQGVVDDRLASGPLFASVAQIYAAPQEVRPGQHLSAEDIAGSLRRAGYNSNAQMGTFNLAGDTIRIKPGPQSYHSADGATINAAGGLVQSITADNGVALRGYQLEPQLITALSEDKGRAKRRLVSYSNIPPHMVDAVVAIEDHRFFEHGGINYVRTAKCAVQDLITHQKECGGSTVTQQLARGFFLSPSKTYKRKIEEIMITYQLEARFTKQQIFEMYANQIPMGQHGTYAIAGFGEAAQTYFGKNLSQLDTAECALLAGIIQRPSYFNPYKHMDRALARRNLVIDQMVETEAITASEAERARAEPIRLVAANIDASEAPYFVDLVHDLIVQRIGEQSLNSDSLRIYTSLDPQLQAAASAAVEQGMRNVDELVRRRHRGAGEDLTYPQVALIALNPHTGQILALVGGRNYNASQLDHALSKRPTGSIFKPVVYAAAYNTSVNGTALGPDGVFTALTPLNDDPTTFTFDGQSYTPGNFERGEFPGMQPAYNALAHSLNIATINLGQMIGFQNVASLANSAGITSARGTPSVAIGTYSATPLDMAGVYTTFANGGVHLTPWALASVRNTRGDIVADFAPEARQVLDPRVAYLTQSLMEDVMNFGTGAAARKAGFHAPAAGKTGTSHDAWFAGYTSNLLCIIWVGNDDYSDIKIQGADAAAPIWANFMLRAASLPQYSDMTGFTAPDGVQLVRIDRATNQLADASCPSDSLSVAFLDGTAPQNTCSHMSSDPMTAPYEDIPAGTDGLPPPQQQPHRNVFQKLFGVGKDEQPQRANAPSPQ